MLKPEISDNAADFSLCLLLSDVVSFFSVPDTWIAEFHAELLWRELSVSPTSSLGHLGAPQERYTF